MEEYFDGSVDLGKRDIGRPKEMTTKVQKFKVPLRLIYCGNKKNKTNKNNPELFV